MARRPTGRLGAALTFYAIWRRLPPGQRRALLHLAGRHGPRLAATAWAVARRRRGAGR